MRLSIEAVDAHCQGDPARVIFGGGIGMLELPGATMFEKMKHMEGNLDWLRKLMLREPRGFPHLCCDLIVPPTDPRCAAGFIILEQQDYYPLMSGTNTMTVATVLLELGLIPIVEPVTEFWLEPPAGPVRLRAHCENGRVRRVDFENVPSFATAIDVPVDVPGFGTLKVSVAYGGMVYAVVDAAQLGLEITPGEAHIVQDAAAAVCEAANAAIGFRHPENPEVNMVEGALFYRDPGDGRNIRQIPVTSGGTVGRTPSGTGLSATTAVMAAKGLRKAGDVFEIEGMFRNPFHARIVSSGTVGPHPSVTLEIGGRTWITGRGRYILEDDDPFPEGFIAADMWTIAREGTPAARMAAKTRT